jgi:hypothetical protein
MAETDRPNWFSRTFGDSVTGANWASIATVGISATAGYFFGNLPGLLIGVLGGGLLAPFINELVHQLGGTSMPTRTTTVPTVPTVAYTPTPILQPDGQNVPRIVASPILQNIVASQPGDIPTAFNARDQIRDALNGNTSANNTRENFDTLVRTALTSERRVENFYTAMRNYQTQQQTYTNGANGAPSEYNNLVSSITTLSGSTSNPLTVDEIRRFVPSLPSVDAIFNAHPSLEQGRALPTMPNIVRLNPGFNFDQPPGESNPAWQYFQYDIDSVAKRFFINAPAQPGQQPARRYLTNAPSGTEEEWNRKSYVEKMNIALMAIEDLRADYEYGASNKINWEAIGGKARWNAIIAAELAKPDGNVSRAIITQAFEESRAANIPADQLNNLGRLIGAAPQIHAYETMRARLTSELQPALTQLTAFRNNEMEASYRQAQSFLNARRQIFAEQRIAIFANDRVPQAQCPDATERFYITYKDCNTPGSPVRTLVGSMVGDRFCITHKFDGEVAAITSASWESAALRAPVPFDREAFVNLANHPGPALASFLSIMPGQLVRAEPATARAPDLGDPTMLALADRFRNNELTQPISLTGGIQVHEHGQPAGIPRKTRENRPVSADDLTMA